MTKVIILGEAQGAEPEKKKIEFVKYLTRYSDKFAHDVSLPKEYQNVLLLTKRYCEGLDLMFAFDNNLDIERGNGVLYLGYFNDGIV
jgi:hypothetical protein